jgi:hypothetical protein
MEMFNCQAAVAALAERCDRDVSVHSVGATTAFDGDIKQNSEIYLILVLQVDLLQIYKSLRSSL